MKRSRRNPWTIVLSVLACLLVFGLSIAASIVRTEGLDGLFDRKRDAVKAVAPNAVPVVDEIEQRVDDQIKDMKGTN